MESFEEKGQTVVNSRCFSLGESEALKKLVYAAQDLLRLGDEKQKVVQKEIWMSIAKVMHSEGWPKRPWIIARSKGEKLLRLRRGRKKNRPFPWGGFRRNAYDPQERALAIPFVNDSSVSELRTHPYGGRSSTAPPDPPPYTRPHYASHPWILPMVKLDPLIHTSALQGRPAFSLSSNPQLVSILSGVSKNNELPTATTSTAIISTPVQSRVAPLKCSRDDNDLSLVPVQGIAAASSEAWNGDSAHPLGHSVVRRTEEKNPTFACVQEAISRLPTFTNRQKIPRPNFFLTSAASSLSSNSQEELPNSCIHAKSSKSMENNLGGATSVNSNAVRGSELAAGQIFHCGGSESEKNGYRVFGTNSVGSSSISDSMHDSCPQRPLGTMQSHAYPNKCRPPPYNEQHTLVCTRGSSPTLSSSRTSFSERSSPPPYMDLLLRNVDAKQRIDLYTRKLKVLRLKKLFWTRKLGNLLLLHQQTASTDEMGSSI
ncbi:unnamed protein product [Calicophoron daubneyi]|uniref:Uncharacterized protein n=1 Tax=Calicophoron daubneyi TaxID=300641 RepID=A0AAV2T403_CALDB